MNIKLYYKTVWSHTCYTKDTEGNADGYYLYHHVLKNISNKLEINCFKILDLSWDQTLMNKQKMKEGTCNNGTSFIIEAQREKAKCLNVSFHGCTYHFSVFYQPDTRGTRRAAPPKTFA